MMTFFLILLLALVQQPKTVGFKAEQQKNTRVKTAYAEKGQIVLDTLKKEQLSASQIHIFLRAFKKEEILELWAKNKSDNSFKKIRTFSICSSSGSLGPKRKYGDGQVPEGFYHIQVFNPYSNFYLSLGLNYPNKSDKLLSKHSNLGGDIFIHGSCVTIGCIPLTDEFIKELYIYTVEAKNNGQSQIPVHIFPFKMDNVDWNAIEKSNHYDSETITFWKNIQKGYTYFETNKKLPTVTVGSDGYYVF